MRKILLGCITFILLAGSCNRKTRDNDASQQNKIEISDLTKEADAWADSVCASLTLEQKAAQLFMPALYARGDRYTFRQLQEYAEWGIGGILLLKGDTIGAISVIDSLRAKSKVMPFVAIDAEWGLAMRLADTPKFPVNSKIGPSADDQLMYDYGREVARECRIIGINMVLGPVVDVSGPRSFMPFRSFGDDPQRVADLAIAYARGLEDGNVISVAKHFPGHGSVSSDSHHRKGVISRSLNEMDSIDLYPFKKWVEQRLTGVMVGHLAVPSIDSQMLPAAVSPTVINDLLRNDLGFTGLVITDAINMKGAEGYTGADAVKAGADIIIAPGDTYTQIKEVVEAVNNGTLSPQVLDDRVKRILFFKYLVGLSSRSDLRHSGKGEKAEVNPDSLSLKLLK